MLASKDTRSAVQRNTAVEVAKDQFPLPQMVDDPVLLASLPNPSQPDFVQPRAS